VSNRVNLIVLTSNANEAEGLVTTLRNGGLPAHGTFTPHAEELAELTAAHPCDLILCCVFDPMVDLAEALAHYKTLDRDIPLVLIAEPPISAQLLTEAMRSGVRDLTERGDPTHLQLVVAREYGDLLQRRALAQVRAKLATSERRTRELIDASEHASAVIQQGIHVSANPAYCALFGYAQAEDLDGFPMLDLVTTEYQAEVKAFLRDVEVGGQNIPKSLIVACVRPDGSNFSGELRAVGGELDGEPCVRVTLRVQEAPKPDGGSAAIDADTGLPSRAALVEELSQRLGTGAGGPLALVLVRIIGLDDIILGQGLTAACDAAAEVASSLQRGIPDGGFLARVGDAAFAVILQPVGQAQAQAVSDTLCRIGQEPLNRFATGETVPNCRSGLALAGPQDSSATALLDRAFRTSGTKRASPAASAAPIDPPTRASTPTRAASAPPPRIPPAPPTAPAKPTAPASQPQPQAPKTSPAGEQAAASQAMAALVSEALSGIGKAELRLVFQPIVSLMGDSQEHYSVLLRLLAPGQQLHEAREFIGAVTAAGLMPEVDRWVIQRAVAELAGQRANGHKINFFINIAEDTLQDESLIAWICDRLRESDVRGNWLTFQFPEDEARRNLTALTRLVDGLSKIKCRIALTRCGQLDNPQLLMQSLPLDFLLFSQDFAHGLADDKVKQHQLTAFADLAKEFNIKSIVTGVEDARALTVLWTAGIDYVQGNFLQRPSPTLEVRG
jgi:PAS domain S-box-containing protein